MNRREFLRALGLGTAALAVSAVGSRLTPKRTVTTVPPGHGTIQRAILASSPGDLLVLEAGGEYREPILFIPQKKRGIGIQGNGASVVTGNQILLGADDFELQNTVFRFQGDVRTALDLSSVTGARIIGNTFLFS